MLVTEQNLLGLAPTLFSSLSPRTCGEVEEEESDGLIENRARQQKKKKKRQLDVNACSIAFTVGNGAGSKSCVAPTAKT
jgi:hypothetical protein